MIAALALSASRPDSFRDERSLVVNASPDRLFSFVDDFPGLEFVVFMNMDRMVGKDFEKGLASMEEIAER